jgi:hypothetical protein
MLHRSVPHLLVFSACYSSHRALVSYGSQQWRLLIRAHIPAVRNPPAATNSRLPAVRNTYGPPQNKSLWGEDKSVVYNCCWTSSAQSFSSPNPAGLMITFYCLRFETPPTWKARSPYSYPPGNGGPVMSPDIGFPCRRLLQLTGLWTT